MADPYFLQVGIGFYEAPSGGHNDVPVSALIDNFWVGETGPVLVVSDSGAPTATVRRIDRETGATITNFAAEYVQQITSDGSHIFTLGGNAVEKWTMTGTFVSRFFLAPYGYGNFLGIATDDTSGAPLLVTSENHVLVMDRSSGAIIRALDVPFVQTVTISGNKAYAVRADGATQAVRCFDHTTGTQLWDTGETGNSIFDLAVAGDTLYGLAYLPAPARLINFNAETGVRGIDLVDTDVVAPEHERLYGFTGSAGVPNRIEGLPNGKLWMNRRNSSGQFTRLNNWTP